MTTTVNIQAHCASNKEVHVTVVDNGINNEDFVLQNGETASRVVYDGRSITVFEMEKVEANLGGGGGPEEPL